MKFNFRTIVAALALPLALSSCSKQNDVNPIAQTDAGISKADISVLNGRLVFANQQAFDQVFASLEKLSESTTSKQSLTAWENTYKYTSLRAAAASESAHLEEFDKQGKVASAYQLVTSFGFPTFFTAFINENGEYQVGNTIYWYHDGFRYQAESETDLAAIKQNPSQAKTKFAAGSHTVKSGSLKVGFDKQSLNPISSLTAQGNDPASFDKYLKDFYYSDNYSHRRIIYATVVYVQNQGGNNGLQHFYTNIRLNIKFEYFNNSYQKWYPAKETFYYNYDLNFSGSTFTVNGSPYNNGGTKTAYLNRSFETGDGLFDITMAQDDIYGSLINYNQTESNVQWNFSINGSINSHAQAASAITFPVSGNLW